MRDALAAASPEAAASFASFLANLAALEPESEEIKPAGTGDADRWDLDDLAEDVATIRQTSKGAGQPSSLSQVSEARAETRAGAPVFGPLRAEEPGTRLSRASSGSVKRRTASVTLRMTDEECVQLHHRAAEAGLTVSAYLRSCAFEVETLRAQVKEALAQLNAASAVAAERNTAMHHEDARALKAQSAHAGLRARIFSRWSS